MILFTTLAIGLAGLLLLCWFGFAPAVWLTPESLKPWRWLLLPWLGYAAFVVVAQFVTQVGVNMGQLVLAALVATTLLNALAFRRWRAVESDSGEARQTLVVVGGLFLLAFALGVLPLLIYGFNTVIGENWDAEIYLALGEYLKNTPQSMLAQATPNPLLTTLLVPPYSLRTHGFSYFQAALSALLNAQSFDTLNPTLALLWALEVPAVFVFLRGVWGWGARPALLTAGLVAVNPFLIWIAFNTFGMQVPSLGLLPASLAAALVVFRDTGERRNWLHPAPRAGLLTAGLAVTYHPALTAWAAVCGAGWLALLVARRGAWLRLLLAGAAVALSAVLLSAVAQWLGLQGFISQYAEQVGGLGLTGFTLPGDGLGLSLSFRDLLSAGENQTLLALAVRGYRLLTLVALACAALLGLYWFIAELRQRRAGGLLRVATLLGGLVYLLAFFWPLRYPYGWFKAQSFVAFLLIGAVVGGAWRLLSQPLLTADPAQPLRQSAALQLGRLVALAAPCLALLATLGLTMWQYRQPLRYEQDTLAVAQVRQWAQPGDAVLLGSSPLMPGRLFNGLASYFLINTDLYGTFNTANAVWDRARPDGVYSWAILSSKDTPGVYGFGAADRVWNNETMAFYRKPATLLDHLDWEKRGDYPSVSASRGVTLSVGSAIVQLAGAPLPAITAAPRQLTLALASFQAQTLHVAGSSGSAAIPLSSGLQTVSLTVTTPATITLSAPGSAFVRWINLATADQARVLPATLTPQPVTGVTMLNVSTSNALPEARTTLQIAGSDSALPIDKVVLDIWRKGGAGGPQDHFGFWAFQRSADSMNFGLNLQNATPLALAGSISLADQQLVGPAQPGDYTASLSLYSGAKLAQTVTDIYTFHLEPASPNQTTFSRATMRVTNLNVRRFPILFY